MRRTICVWNKNACSVEVENGDFSKTPQMSQFVVYDCYNILSNIIGVSDQRIPAFKGEVSWRFFTYLVKNGEVRPSHSYKTILEQREERDQLNS